MVAEHGADSVYKSHSRSIVRTSEDLKAKAESQLVEARQTEVTASHDFQMRQQFLEDELKFNAQDLEAAKHSAGEAQGQLTTDTADLKMTEDALAEDTAALEDTRRDCQAKSVEFETATNGRSEELDARAKARAVISQKTGGAESFSYGLTQTLFLQLSRSVLSSQDVNTHVQHVVHTVEVERPRIIKQTVQKPIIQEKINPVTKHVEVPLSQFTGKSMNIPVVAQRQIPMDQTVQKTMEISQLQCVDEVIDVPVVSAIQAPRVRVVKKTVEDSQLQIVEKITQIPEIRTVRDTQTSESLSVVDSKGSNRQDCEVLFRVNRQSPDIAGGVRVDRDDLHVMSAAQHHSTQQQHNYHRKQQQQQAGQTEEEKEERDAEEQECKQVKKDATGWTVVTRNKRQREMVQIFVRVNGSKATPMDVNLTDDKVDDVIRRVQNDEDVYVTMHGRVLKRGEKLKSCEVADGCKIQVTSRLRGGGNTRTRGARQRRTKPQARGHQSRSSRRKQRVSKVQRLRSVTGTQRSE